jgi:hypothetical protein
MQMWLRGLQPGVLDNSAQTQRKMPGRLVRLSLSVVEHQVRARAALRFYLGLATCVAPGMEAATAEQALPQAPIRTYRPGRGKTGNEPQSNRVDGWQQEKTLP